MYVHTRAYWSDLQKRLCIMAILFVEEIKVISNTIWCHLLLQNRNYGVACVRACVYYRICCINMFILRVLFYTITLYVCLLHSRKTSIFAIVLHLVLSSLTCDLNKNGIALHVLSSSVQFIKESHNNCVRCKIDDARWKVFFYLSE